MNRDLIYLDPPFNSELDYQKGESWTNKAGGKPFKGVAKEPDKRRQ